MTPRRPTSARLTELDWRRTPMGELTLRRRHDPVVGAEVYEVLLGDEFLMSSTFTAGEVALAQLGLAALGDRAGSDGTGLDVMVGGLGLGYTAGAVLEDPRVHVLHVVEALEEVVDWHRRGLLPLSPRLTDDPRCVLTHADFFRTTARDEAVGEGAPRVWDAVLVDIDHSPRAVLHPSHAAFYGAEGLRRVLSLLRPAGVFALWSDDAPDDEFLAVLRSVFASADAHVVPFPNPLTGGTAANTVYVALAAGA